MMIVRFEVVEFFLELVILIFNEVDLIGIIDDLVD